MAGRVRNMLSGYLTVWLALLMTVLTGFCLGLIEGVRKNAVALEAECTVEAAWNGVFAEYHRGLAQRFQLFAIDASYGTSYATPANIERHLIGYLDRNLQLPGGFWNHLFYKDFLGLSLKKAEITGGMRLSDYGGAVFRHAAVEAQKDRLNLVLLEKVQYWLGQIQANGLERRDVEEEKEQADKRLQKAIEDLNERGKTVDFQNPTFFLEEIRKKGILNWVTGEDVALSRKALRQEELFSARLALGAVGQGNHSIENASGMEQLLERFLFQEYLLTYLGDFSRPLPNTALDYQIEYILAGKPMDVQNLNSVFGRISAIREAANALYLLSDKEKSAKTELVATVLTSLIGQPQLAEPLQLVLVLGWAFGETLHDMELLAAGQAVPLLKEDVTWHYSLENLLEHWWDRTDKESQGADEGMYYRDYLRVLMFLTDLDQLTLRSMDLVEADIRLLLGNSDFCLDNCYTQLQAEIQLESSYGYTYELSRYGIYKE